MAATSEPASGSLTATAVMHSPRQMAGSQRACCSALPALTRWGLAMSVCTSTVMTAPPLVARASASCHTTLVSMSAPPPPCSAGCISPSQPSAPILRSSSRGVLPASSQASACGSISAATKRATWRRRSACSGRSKIVVT